MTTRMSICCLEAKVVQEYYLSLEEISVTQFWPIYRKERTLKICRRKGCDEKDICLALLCMSERVI